MAVQGHGQGLGAFNPEVHAAAFNAGDGRLRDAAQRGQLVLAQACSSRMIRSDSPGETSTRLRAGMKLRMSAFPVVMGCDMDDEDQQLIRLNLVDHAPLFVEPG